MIFEDARYDAGLRKYLSGIADFNSVASSMYVLYSVGTSIFISTTTSLHTC